jgi:hypothetical protein
MACSRSGFVAPPRQSPGRRTDGQVRHRRRGPFDHVPLALPFPFSVAVFDVILVVAAVTLNAIVEITDTSFGTLAVNVCQRELVAARAGVATVVVADMTCNTARVVVAVEDKGLVDSSERSPLQWWSCQMHDG